MRILHVIGWLAPGYGGPVATVRAMATGLAGLGHHVDIVSTDVDGARYLAVPIGRRVAQDGYHVIYFHAGPLRRFLVAPGLLRFLSRHVRDYDIVTVHSLYRFPNLVGTTLARWASVPYIVRPHGSLEPVHRARRRAFKRPYHWAIEDRNIRGARAIQYSSRKEEVGSGIGAWMPRAFVIPNPIDVTRLRQRGLSGEVPNVPPGDWVTFLGRITRNKGLELLLRAFLALGEDFPAARLVIAGPDEDGTGARVAAMAAAAGRSDRVHLLGPVFGDAAAALVRSSQIFALPSDSENFGVAAAEAMALGVPVIVSDQVGIAELVEESHAGLVIPQTIEALSAALASYLRAPEDRRQAGDRGAAAAQAQLDISEVALALERMYRTVIADSRRPGGGQGVGLRTHHR